MVTNSMLSSFNPRYSIKKLERDLDRLILDYHERHHLDHTGLRELNVRKNILKAQASVLSGVDFETKLKDAETKYAKRKERLEKRKRTEASCS